MPRAGRQDRGHRVRRFALPPGKRRRSAVRGRLHHQFGQPAVQPGRYPPVPIAQQLHGGRDGQHADDVASTPTAAAGPHPRIFTVRMSSRLKLANTNTRLPRPLLGAALAVVHRIIGARFENFAPRHPIPPVESPPLLVYGDADSVLSVAGLRELAALRPRGRGAGGGGWGPQRPRAIRPSLRGDHRIPEPSPRRAAIAGAAARPQRMRPVRSRAAASRERRAGPPPHRVRGIPGTRRRPRRRRRDRRPGASG